jgi:hypothetical protein
MKRHTPQEKKALSYKRDRRNCYGESPHAARKSIPLRKALRNRANRRYENQQLDMIGVESNQEVADAVESQMKHRAPKNWKKHPDEPLGEAVSWKLKKREVMRTQGGRRALVKVSYDTQKGKEKKET